jgi:dTDP-4-dehydrorhamnose reductase
LILVFGAGGQLGQELSAAAADRVLSLVALSHRDADIADERRVREAMRQAEPSVVINAAAYNAVDRAEVEIDAAMRANAVGPGVLARACDACGAALIHVSTDYVFDGEKDGPYCEDDAVRPLGAYAISKAAGEDAVRGGCREHLIVRTAWVFGTYGSNFLKTMLRLAAERDHLDVVADQRGSPTATPDLAHALLTAAQAITTGRRPWGTYHFAGSGETTRHEMARRIVAAQRPFTGRAPAVNPIAAAEFPTPAKRPKNSVLDSTKFARTFGVRARDWRDAVDATVRALFESKAAA